jgi:signal transduction histidine kinase
MKPLVARVTAIVRTMRAYSTVCVVTGVGLGLSLLVFGLLRLQLEAHRIVELEWAGHNRYRALENGIWRGLDAVRSLADLVLVKPDLGARDFDIMASSVLRRTDGLAALIWAPRVRGDKRTEWEQTANGLQSHKIVQRSREGSLEPAMPQNDYFPVSYLAARSSPLLPHGFDLNSDPGIRDALERAHNSGATAVSKRLHIGAQGHRVFGFVAVQPLFLRRETQREQTDPSLAGFVVGLFLLADLTQAAIDPLEPRGVDCLIRDESSVAGQHFLDFYASRLSTTPAPLNEAPWPEKKTGLSRELFPVADRKWSVTCAPTPHFRSAEAFAKGPLGALAMGVFLTFLLTSYLIRRKQSMIQTLNLQNQAARNARLASIGVLAAGVAHEINNPNNAILFNASILSRAWSDMAPILREYHREEGDFALANLSFAEASDTLPELLAQITMNANRIQRIVENLKYLSRRDRSAFSEEVDVGASLEAAVEILRKQTQEHTDHFQFRRTDELPTVRGSSQQLAQVFINVILNALQALPDRTCGVSIDVSADPEAASVLIRVRDEGEGISRENLASLTEPFFSTREDSGGTGLGLSISQTIIERHGGQITFDSELGRGTTVTIALPAAIVEQE